jgi:hypothetical protein
MLALLVGRTACGIGAMSGRTAMENDPTQLRRLTALAVNQLVGCPIDAPVRGRQLREAAVKAGLFTFDTANHCVTCPANHFSRTRLPTGPCNCGAARRAREAADD